jgi:hypothetical protein
VLRLQSRDVGLYSGIVPVPLEEFRDPGAGVSKKSFVDELDGRGGALDIQQDCADLGQLAAALRGKYTGPMQSGWYP